MHEALKVLAVLQAHTTTKFGLDHALCGGRSLLEKSKHCDAVIFNAVGGPEWGHMQPNPEAGLSRLWAHLEAFADAADAVVERC